MKWKCLRCEFIFDDSNKVCKCTEGASPWAPLNDKLEEISYEEWSLQQEEFRKKVFNFWNQSKV